MDSTLFITTRHSPPLCPIIDMHGHFGPYGGFYLPRAPMEMMLRTLEGTDVKVITCSPHSALMGDPARGNSFMQEVNLFPPPVIHGLLHDQPQLPGDRRGGLISGLRLVCLRLKDPLLGLLRNQRFTPISPVPLIQSIS